VIVTFYSFKGGVGRSMAMANVGAWLYQQGRRVLMLDWDLEAPGLESFFSHDSTQLESIRSKPGLMDLIESYRQLWQHPMSSERDAGSNADRAESLTKRIGTIRHLFQPLAGTSEEAISTARPGIWLLHAGCRAGASEAFYSESVQALDWRNFYEKYGGYSFSEWLRRELEREVDFVLIDSRTGVTEMGGVCTQHLADVVILMFAPNDANLEGANRIAKLLVSEKVKELRGSSRPLAVFPIPTRVDTQGATERLEIFEKKFRAAFEGLSVVDLDWCWESKVRYVSSYSYEESVLFLELGGHKDLKLAYERIGGQILRLQEEKLSLSDRESQARSRPTTQQTPQDSSTDRSQETIQQLISTARAQMDSGDFKTGSNLLTSALALAEKDLGHYHPDTLSAMNNLAASLYAQGDLARARPLLEGTLAIRETLVGREHPDIAIGLDKLATLLRAQGDLAGAKPLLERALAIRERALGPEHLDTAIGLENLAGLHRAQGDLASAQPLLERALAIRQRAVGPEHPDTATGLDNLATLLQSQGDLASAQPLLERALAIRERALGPEHPDTATTLGNLAGLLQNTNRLAEAERLYRRALQIDEASFGADHPNVATRLNNLAVLFQAMNRIEEAELLFRRAGATFEKSLGPDNPHVAVNLKNLGALLQATNRLEEAEPLLRRALAINEANFGRHHPEVAKSLNDLAELLRATDRFEEAERLFKRAFAIYQRRLGADHPNTISVHESLAALEPRLAAARRAEQPLVRARDHSSKMRWYISFAWSDDNNPKREEEVYAFCEEAGRRGIEIVRDKTTLAPGDLISEFMQKIGDDDRVYIFLSGKYLHSPYCMLELFEMWRNGRQNKAEFLRRVRLFTVDGVRIGTPDEWLEYVAFWKRERDTLGQKIAMVSWADAGEEVIKRFRCMETFASKISDVLALFADIGHPRNFDEFLEYEFDDLPEAASSH
jgi:tetratricopeptide (TPR) repeat protein/cellulose biosynthesis protein BcsQ